MIKIKVKIVKAVMAGKQFPEENLQFNKDALFYYYQTDIEHFLAYRNSHPATNGKRKFWDFKIRFALSRWVSKWNLVNNKANN